MPDGSSVTAWLPAVTALIAGGFALGGARLGARNDALKWRREKRVQAYSEFLSEIDRRVRELITWVADTNSAEVLAEVPLPPRPPSVRSTADLTILGPEAVAKASVDLSTALEKLYAETLAWHRAGRPRPKVGGEVQVPKDLETAMDGAEKARKMFVAAARGPLGTSRKR